MNVLHQTCLMGYHFPKTKEKDIKEVSKTGKAPRARGVRAYRRVVCSCARVRPPMLVGGADPPSAADVDG